MKCQKNKDAMQFALLLSTFLHDWWPIRWIIDYTTAKRI